MSENKTKKCKFIDVLRAKVDEKSWEIKDKLFN